MSKDNWIEWNGGECPVDGYVMVDVLYKNYSEHEFATHAAYDIEWSHFENDDYNNVVAYRVHTPTIIDQVAKAQSEFKKLKEHAQKANDALVKANEELVRMVKRLEQEVTYKTGMSCVIGVEVHESVKVDAEVKEDKLKELCGIPDGVDIDDWRTWVKGDDWLRKSISSGNEYTTNGTDEGGIEINYDDEGDENYIRHTEDNFRFVRRP